MAARLTLYMLSSQGHYLRQFGIRRKLSLASQLGDC